MNQNNRQPMIKEWINKLKNPPWEKAPKTTEIPWFVDLNNYYLINLQCLFYTLKKNLFMMTQVLNDRVVINKIAELRTTALCLI